MNRCSGKRGATGSMAPTKGYSVGSKDAPTARDQNTQFCNRIGCHGRIKYFNQNTKFGSSVKAKCSKASFCSSNENKMIGLSSRSVSVMTRTKRPCLDSKRKLFSQLEFDPSENSQSGDSETAQLMSAPGSSPASRHQGTTKTSGKVAVGKSGSSSVPSNIRSRKMFRNELGLDKENTRAASSVPSISKSSGLGTLNISKKGSSLKNLKCNSISDVLPPNSSSSGSKSAGKYMMKKRSPEEEGSLSRRGGKTTAAATFDGKVSASTGGVSISASRRGCCTSGEGGSSATSVRSGRPNSVNRNRMRISYRENGRNSSCSREPDTGISRFPGSEHPTNVGRTSLSQQFSGNGSSSGSSSYSLSSSNDDYQSTLIPFTSGELGFSHLVRRDALQLYNMDGIAEILLAPDRIEQDEEMTDEQILALETTLFLSSFNLNDQHRDMRLDIDNMTYEELLALGERMGTVSTALSEEALLKCVKTSIYQVTHTEVRFTGSGEDRDDTKCSICQEEYATGDEIGKLVECQHSYHVTCINQWLRLKNWCPICKTAAASSESSSS